jgi:hypothetical protein
MPTKTFDFLPAQADGMSAKASGNQAMVRKIRAPGFIFVADLRHFCFSSLGRKPGSQFE